MDSLEPCLHYQFTVQDLPGINILEGQLKASTIMKDTHFDCVTSLLAFKTQNWKTFLQTYIRKQDTKGKTNISQWLPLPKLKQNQNFFFSRHILFSVCGAVLNKLNNLFPLCLLLSVDPGLWWYEPWMDR